MPDFVTQSGQVCVWVTSFQILPPQNLGFAGLPLADTLALSFHLTPYSSSFLVPSIC